MIIGVYIQDKDTLEVSKNPIIDQDELKAYLYKHRNVRISHMTCLDGVNRIVLTEY